MKVSLRLSDRAHLNVVIINQSEHTAFPAAERAARIEPINVRYSLRAPLSHGVNDPLSLLGDRHGTPPRRPLRRCAVQSRSTGTGQSGREGQLADN